MIVLIFQNSIKSNSDSKKQLFDTAMGEPSDQLVLAVIAQLTRQKQGDDLINRMIGVPFKAVYHMSRSTNSDTFMGTVRRLATNGQVVYIDMMIVIYPDAVNDADAFINQYNEAAGRPTSFEDDYCDTEGFSTYLIRNRAMFTKYETNFLDQYFNLQYDSESLVKEVFKGEVRDAMNDNVSDNAETTRFNNAVRDFHLFGILEDDGGGSINVPQWLLWIQDRTEIEPKLYG